MDRARWEAITRRADEDLSKMEEHPDSHVIEQGLSARPIWPTTLFFARWPDHHQVAPDIIDHLYSAKEQASHHIDSGVALGAKPNQGLFESRFDLFSTEHAGLKKLIGFIGRSLQSAIAQVNGVDTEPSKIRVAAVESWFHITNDGGFHDGHHHYGCSWCGIYYVQAGDPRKAPTDKNGMNRFYSPLTTGGAYTDFGNQYLRRTSIFDITPEDGMLVLFPSFLLHSALPYQGARDRIVISFNSQAFHS